MKADQIAWKYIDVMSRLENFNMLKYTDHYVFTIDRGMGRPIVFQGEDLSALLKEVMDYLDRVGYPGEF